MLPLLIQPLDRPLRVLCLGAHCDDIEIGAGGTVRTLIEGHAPVDCRWVVFSSNDVREAEARASAAEFLAGAHEAQIDVLRFKESFFPSEWVGIKEAFEDVRRAFEPDLVLTHHGRDLHQDHRVVAELTWNTFRNHLVLEYEIPKYDADLGQPNVFVELSPEVAARKIETVVRSFASQRSKGWFDEETFRAVLRLRGLESNASSRYAEAFHARKLPLAFTPPTNS